MCGWGGEAARPPPVAAGPFVVAPEAAGPTVLDVGVPPPAWAEAPPPAGAEVGPPAGVEPGVLVPPLRQVEMLLAAAVVF